MLPFPFFAPQVFACVCETIPMIPMLKLSDSSSNQGHADARVYTELATNKRAWDKIAPKFSGHCALPDWGPFGECRSVDVLGDLRGLTVLEVGCGSGDSIAGVVERGAEKVFGIDI